MPVTAHRATAGTAQIALAICELLLRIKCAFEKSVSVQIRGISGTMLTFIEDQAFPSGRENDRLICLLSMFPFS